MHSPVRQASPRPRAWRRTGGVAQNVYGKRTVAIRAAMARCRTETTSNATPTPGAGLNRATIAGHAATPRPQQKLSPPSAAAARSGVSRATIRLVVGTTRPSPMPATADPERAGDSLAEREAGHASRHQPISCGQRCAAAEAPRQQT